MGLFDRILGNEPPQMRDQQPRTGQSEDEQAIARYRYMLKTAPPETIELAHAEAFAKLTPGQRNQVLQSLSSEAPAAERAAATAGGADPNALARLATRAELRQPGTMERTLGRAGGIGLGGLMAGSLLSTIAGTVIGSMIAHQFFSHDTDGGTGGAGSAASDPMQDADYAADDSGDFGGDTFDV